MALRISHETERSCFFAILFSWVSFFCSIRITTWACFMYYIVAQTSYL